MPDLTVLSLGAGVQSSCVALMAAAGEVTPMPDCAIMADTHWEPEEVYRWLWWLVPRLPFPVYIVSAGSVRAAGAGRLPMFTESPDGPRGMLHRSCTDRFKVRPIMRKVRELLGVGKGRVRGKMVERWIGISLDEAHRMKPSREPWCETRWPLIEKRMTRQDCLNWMQRHGYPEPPKSACVGCPFHSDSRWLEMKRKAPDEWADAVAFDRDNRRTVTRYPAYLHGSLKPLDKVELSENQLDLFGNECEGLCGT